MLNRDLLQCFHFKHDATVASAKNNFVQFSILIKTSSTVSNTFSKSKK